MATYVGTKNEVRAEKNDVDSSMAMVTGDFWGRVVVE